MGGATELYLVLIFTGAGTAPICPRQHADPLSPVCRVTAASSYPPPSAPLPVPCCRMTDGLGGTGAASVVLSHAE